MSPLGVAFRTMGRDFYFADYFERESVGENWNTSALASAEITSDKLVTEAKANTAPATRSGAVLLGNLHLFGDFEVETSLEWVSRAGDEGSIYLNMYDEDGEIILVGVQNDTVFNPDTMKFRAFVDGSPIYEGAGGSLPYSGSVIIKVKRVNDTLSIYQDGTSRLTATYTGTLLELRLLNHRFETYDGKTAKWDYVTIT